MVPVIAIALGLIAMMYASVGHGGASGYLAVLAISGSPPDQVRATALLLNVIVSGVALLHFARCARFRLDLLVRFAAPAVPSALLAGAFASLEPGAFNFAVSAVLLFAAARMALPAFEGAPVATRHPPGLVRTIPIGAGIGLASGLIGVGGGIFLSPILLLCRWATPKETAAVSAAFILLSSVAGLVGLAIQFNGLPIVVREAGLYGIGVLLGGWIGARLGASRLTGSGFRRALAVVLFAAAIKLTFDAIW